VSDHSGGVNREVTRVKVAQTSSGSCSAGGVLGREGATDSAARRTIVVRVVVVRGKESAEFKNFGGKYSCRPGKESRIPKYHTGHAQREIQAIDSDYIFGHPSPTTSTVVPPRRRTDRPAILNPQAKLSKVRVEIQVEIQVEIEDVLLWPMVHTIWIGTESVLWLFVGFR